MSCGGRVLPDAGIRLLVVGRQQALVDADGGDARLHRLVVERIHQLLVVEPPRELRRVERIADRVALPRIGLVHRDRLVDLVHPARLVGRDQGMRQKPPRAREAVDQRARLGHLRVGQEPPGRIVERRAAQQGQAGVAVVVDLLDVVLELVAGERRHALRLHLGVPVLARELGQAQKLLVIEVVAHEVGLHVEDELARQPLRARACASSGSRASAGVTWKTLPP